VNPLHSAMLVIAASIIAAVRLARDDISRSSSRLTAVIGDSVALARMILGKSCMSRLNSYQLICNSSPPH
jgi:hypothetical protein